MAGPSCRSPPLPSLVLPTILPRRRNGKKILISLGPFIVPPSDKKTLAAAQLPIRAVQEGEGREMQYRPVPGEDRGRESDHEMRADSVGDARRGWVGCCD